MFVYEEQSHFIGKFHLVVIQEFYAEVQLKILDRNKFHIKLFTLYLTSLLERC